MSAKADKGDRKIEIVQSPMKKKFRDSAISSEDLDDAIANRIELAFKGFPVAQMVEHGASNAKIMGSIPRESKN